ncbi:helix-turn-helix transcriptional regulator [Rhizobium sp. BR 362]|uniref:helix-turn-helix transcriptional regulator n=1 Tax=Rhizobium sp. BR 362 TaxID=3040670 RepID=UPI002F40813D
MSVGSLLPAAVRLESFFVSDERARKPSRLLHGSPVCVHGMVRHGIDVVLQRRTKRLQVVRRANEKLTFVREQEFKFFIFFPLCRNEVVYGALCFTNARPFTQGEREFLSMMVEPLHSAVTKTIMDRFAADHLRLTRGELLCLKLASRGLTSEEIANQSCYTLETINSYLKSATRKLGASNRVEAVAEAIRKRLIDRAACDSDYPDCACVVRTTQHRNASFWFLRIC